MAGDKVIAGVLLAAGSGSRFGGEKLLHPLDDGVAIAAHAARNLLAAVPDVIAVVRWGDFPLYEMLEQEGCHVYDVPGGGARYGREPLAWHQTRCGYRTVGSFLWEICPAMIRSFSSEFPPYLFVWIIISLLINGCVSSHFQRFLALFLYN